MRIAAAEYGERLARLQREVAAHELDAFLVSGRDSIFYLFGLSYEPLERPFFAIVRPRERPALLVPALEQEHLRGAPNVGSVKRYWDYPSPVGEGWPERLHVLLEGVQQLGVEPSLPQEIATVLGEHAPQVLPLVERLRLVKSPDEITMVQQAAHYADLAVSKVIGASYHGASELELFAQGRDVQLQIMKDVGYEALTTSVLVAAWPAPLSAQPHGVPSIDDRLGEGPHIALCLIRVFGYAAECERTYFTTPPTQRMREVFGAMMEARRRAFALLRPGVACDEIDAATSDFLRTEGYGDALLHRTGHGFGLGNHEGPWLARGSADRLAAGMVVSNEPGIYLPGVGGFRHSDTILITGDGCEPLTRCPTDLEALVVRAAKPLTRLRGTLIRRAVRMR